MKKLWIDTETTGTNPRKHAIVQLAGMVEIDGVIVEEFDIRMRPFPNAFIDDRALDVNHLTREEVMAYPDHTEGFRQFCAIMERHINVFKREDKFTLAGYNTRFDEEFLRELFNMCGSKYFGSYFWFPALDVAQFAHAHFCAYKRRHRLINCKLSSVATAMNIPLPENLHDAMADIRLTRQVWLAIQEGEKQRILRQHELQAEAAHEGC